MQIIIMCGGVYDDFTTPKQLSEVNGEPLVERTIRLLRENGKNDIYISTNDVRFRYLKVPILEHTNSYEVNNGKVSGYWVDAYFPTDKPTIYLHGDVYYTEDAIKKILNLKPKVNTFIGNEIARNKEHKNWGEPFGWIVVNQKVFRAGIEVIKELQDRGKLERGFAISWELYRLLNGSDVNYMLIDDNNYLSIDDETIDVDFPEMVDKLNEKLKTKGE